MTEDEAIEWLGGHFDERQFTALQRFVDLIEAERPRQNLISPRSAEAIWARHVVDSAQLLALAPSAGSWCDIGTGAGFPGMVVAILHDGPVTMIEPRRKRAEFLQRCIDDLGLQSTVLQERAETARMETMDVVSARAVASITDLLKSARHFSTEKTRFVLPRGRTGRDEIANAKAAWHGMFHVEHSVTDPDSVIVSINGVRPRCSASR